MAFISSQNLDAANRLCQVYRDNNLGITVNDPVVASDDSITITLGAGTTGAAGFLIRFVSDPLIQHDSLGNASRAYAPSLLQIAGEENASAGSGALIAADTFLLQGQVVGIANTFGYEVDMYVVANGAFPVVGDFVAANLKGRIRPDPRFGMISQN